MRRPEAGRPFYIHGFWGLCLGVTGSALGTVLMRHSDFGLSSFYSVSLALYKTSGIWTMGTWNTVFQAGLILLLILLLRRFRMSYLLSFAVVECSSVLIDLLHILSGSWPVTIPFRLLCFAAGLVILCFGISLLASCKLPVMPMNLFVREIAEDRNWPFSRFKFCFDIGCLVFSAAVSWFGAGQLYGVGWGTLFSTFCTGPLVGAFLKLERKRFAFYVNKEEKIL